ncbi:DUF460 domain-containing protein [Candidatus Woesearchaeota archaeon]|nr:DUF460 domain-containing protein [Candidatus Woesearchaeota archaeon]
MKRDTQKLKKLLILGIDPGTTTAYAILDIDGNVLDVKSKKHYSPSSLIMDTVKHGRVLLVGTDVKNTPFFVKKTATRLGAKVISPDYDLKINDKKELTKDYKNMNDHERDALSSAIFAFKRKKGLLNKVNLYLEKNNRTDLKNEMMELLMLTPITLTEAFNSLIQVDNEIKVKRKRNKTGINIEFKKNEIELLKQQNYNLMKEINILRGRLVKKESEIDNKIKESLKFKEKRISQLSEESKKYLMEIKKLNNRISKLNSYLRLTESHILVNKVGNLSRDINFNVSKILFVENPNIFSEKLFSKMKDEISVIIYKIKPNEIINDRLSQVLIDVSKLKIEEDNDFILIDKESLNNEIKKTNLLDNVIKNYKKERAKLQYSQA